MKFLFIWPHKDQPGYKSLSIALLSAILKKAGHEVDLFDTTFIDFGFKDNTEVRSKLRIFKEVVVSDDLHLTKQKVNLQDELFKKLEKFKPDVVGVSALSDEIYVGFKISEIVKKWNKKAIVLWGNKAASMAPENVFSCKAVDYICVGEGLEFINEFANAIEQGKDVRHIKNLGYKDLDGHVHINELRPYYQGMDSLPFLDWDIFDKRQFYKPFNGKIYIGGDHMVYWGCVNNCTYCINDSYRKLYGKKAGKFLRCYSVDRIIRELKFLVDKWKVTFFKFHDEDFCLKPYNYLDEFSGKYAKELNIPFTIMANARNVTVDKVKLLKKMNCVSVTLGIETGNSLLRKKMLKRVETKQEIIKATKFFNEAGIRTASFNMLAIPFETRKTIKETIALNKRANVRYPNAGFFFPLDGTELKEIAIQSGFFAKNSHKVFCNDVPALTLPGISSEELVKIRERFTLYIKMPRFFYPYIERSEKNDDISRRLTSELYSIYDEAVLANDGVWNDCGKNKSYLKNLESIYKVGKK